MLENGSESDTLGILLMDFFNYYGSDFPYATSYISVTEGKVLSKKAKGFLVQKQPDLLSIQCLIDSSMLAPAGIPPFD